MEQKLINRNVASAVIKEFTVLVEKTKGVKTSYNILGRVIISECCDLYSLSPFHGVIMW